MRRYLLHRALAVAAVALSLVMATAAPARAASTGWVESYYMLVNSYTNQCLQVDSTAAGTVVHQWPCWGGDNQRWLWKRYYHANDLTIRVRYTGYCLTHTSAVEVQSPCVPTGTFSQKYNQVGLGGGTGLYEIRDYLFRNCLEVQGWSTVNGAPVVLAPCTGGANQRWRMA